ncbi:MAG: Exodeoxyribonuclease 7 large subunit [Acidimicrobiales bacterium]|nr:Exodeoxyribonuclease 7 large subunit [Acidimicrobiales bacterium]
MDGAGYGPAGVTEPSLFDEPGAPGGSPTWTVAELAAHLGRVVAGAFPADLWVEGQIRNLSRAPNGHVYFQLTEPAEAGQPPRSQLAVTLLAPEKQHVNEQLKRAGGAVRMDDGIEVRIRGRIRWYGPRGVLQLRMHGIDPAFTIGRLHADRERILATLATEGLLDANASLAFPLVPLRIGLVTSRRSAAHADVLSELEASGYSFIVRDVDARTQGDECGPSVTRALHRLAADGVDVILLVRGGGARTDLAAFDSELIARAIAAMPVPVLTGIGHEVDRSIADEVAHRAHKTPTAAAADVVRALRTFLDRVDRRAVSVHRAGSSVATVARSRLDRRSIRLGRAAGVVLTRRSTQLDSAASRTARSATRQLATAAATLDRHAGTVARRAPAHLARAERALDGVEARLHAHDPQRALARGWSITTTSDGRLVRSPADVSSGTAITTRTAAGTIASTVTSTDPRPEATP